MNVCSLKTSPAFLSTRLSLAWIPGPPSEHTDTLVLTGSKYYVDCRVRKSDGEIDWVMAGETEQVGGTDERATIKFTNVLDSRHPSTNTVSSTDTANFTLLSSGNTLEEGTMTNATTALPQKFEEIWAPVPVPSGSTVLILESVSEGKAKGFVGVCGEWALGVFVQEEGGYGGWKGKKGGEEKGWEVTWEKGEERVGWVGGGKGGDDAPWKDWREGDEVEWAGRTWRVLEHSLTA